MVSQSRSCDSSSNLVTNHFQNLLVRGGPVGIFTSQEPAQLHFLLPVLHPRRATGKSTAYYLPQQPAPTPNSYGDSRCKTSAQN
mmetsp:Transcript_551/g.1129  ORF Transcript_551/g.1129 Transcript_551/m.1129 type:complete len:84 (-) Transcript_551:407-658(-)